MQQRAELQREVERLRLLVDELQRELELLRLLVDRLLSTVIYAGHSEDTVISYLGDADSVVVPGALFSFDERLKTVVPKASVLSRCHTEYHLRQLKVLHKNAVTIASGGKRGVPEEPKELRAGNATEASLIIDFQVKQYRQRRASYIAEPYALDIFSNVVFASRVLLQNKLSKPVFICQSFDLFRLKLIADHWLERTNIRPVYWMAADTPGSRDVKLLYSTLNLEDCPEEEDWSANVESGGSIKKGMDHVALFLDEVPPLRGDDLDSNRDIFLQAIDWLYKNVADEEKIEGGKIVQIPRYERYVQRSELIEKLGLQ